MEHKSATADWNSKRGKSHKFTNNATGKVKKKLGKRNNVGGNVNRFVKFKVTMTHKNGTEMNVDPILDERPN